MGAFIGAMDAMARARAPELVKTIRPGDARHFLDIGGASGTYTIAFLRAAPQMRATLFDLPPVIALARRRLQAEGMLRRVTLVAGDFYRNPLPTGHDLALLSAIIHQNSRTQNAALYRKTFRALTPGGRLVVRDHIMNPDRTRPRDGALFAVNMLCGTPGGGTYTFPEVREDLKAAGFTRVRLLRKGDDRMNGIVEAFRPARG
jgi:predicted O-methyltransferase YrrM